MIVRTNSAHLVNPCSQIEENSQDGETLGEKKERETKEYVLENKFFHILPSRVVEMS